MASKPPPPVPFPEVGEFYLDLARRPPLDPLHHRGEREMRWDRHERMDVIAGQDTLLNAYAHFAKSLPDNVLQSQLDITTHYLENDTSSPKPGNMVLS